jgi:hypothetical protein
MGFKFPADAGLMSDRVQAVAVLTAEIKYTFYTYCDIEKNENYHILEIILPTYSYVLWANCFKLTHTEAVQPV